MTPVEIITIIVAVAVVAAVVITSIIRKAKGKSSGCSGCAGCPYAGNCSSSAHKACGEPIDIKALLHDNAQDENGNSMPNTDGSKSVNENHCNCSCGATRFEQSVQSMDNQGANGAE